jgi:pimeloyl-ACP methyl ester carboxylesterase
VARILLLRPRCRSSSGRRTIPMAWIPHSSSTFGPSCGSIPRDSLRTLTQTNHTDVETDFRAELRGINVRTWVVHGDEDRTCQFETTASTAISWRLPEA